MTTYSTTRLATAFVNLLPRYPLRQACAALALEISSQPSMIDLDHLVHTILEQLLLKQGILLATVTSATPLTSANQAALVSFLRQHTGAGTVLLDQTIDAAQLGGLRVTGPSFVLDLSFKNILNRIKNL